jgi:hypothetical protein
MQPIDAHQWNRKKQLQREKVVLGYWEMGKEYPNNNGEHKRAKEGARTVTMEIDSVDARRDQS